MLLPLLQNNLLASGITLSGGSTAPMGQSVGSITFIPIAASASRPPIKHGGGAATWDDNKEFIKRRRKQLDQDDEEIMIFVKSFLTHNGAD